MPVPTTINDLDTDESLNSPLDSEMVTPTTRPSDYLRAHGAIIKQLSVDSMKSSTLAASGGSALVGFIQTGTGATARTLQDKARETFSTPDYAAVVDGATDDSTPLANAIAARLGGTVKIPVGTSPVGDVQNNGVSIRGDGYGSILKAKAAATTVMKLGHVATPSQWAKRRIVDAMIDGNAKASAGLTLSAAADTEVSGRWVVEDSVIKACSKGVYKPNGNIGNAFRGVNFTGNDYGVFAVSQASPIMHAGCDLFDDCEFSGNALAAIYYNSSVEGTGGVQLRNNTIIEGNAGFGIFVKNWKTSYTPFLIDGVWFEANATSPSVTIEGVAYTPTDIYLENCDLAVFQNGLVPHVKLVNSKITIDRSFLSDGNSAIDADATSTVTITNAHTDGGGYAFEIQSLANANRVAGNFALRCLAPPRSEKSHNQTGLLQSVTFANADTYTFTGTPGSVDATTVADGRIFDSCAELTIPASYTLLQPAFTITNGKWYVFTLDFKHVSGALAELAIDINDATTLGQGLDELITTGQWQTLAVVAKAGATADARLRLTNGATGQQVTRLSALQVVEFDDEQSAINYYNNREYKMPHDLPRVIYSTVPPTTGTWAVKDICWNTAPASAGAPGWVCTTAGTPGTWTAMANLA